MGHKAKRLVTAGLESPTEQKVEMFPDCTVLAQTADNSLFPLLRAGVL